MKNEYVTTKTAMHFAGLHQLRFNEAYAKGFYPCAPGTVAGSSRRWTRDDLVALRFYRLSLTSGVLPRIAGAHACELLMFMRNHPKEQVAYRTYLWDTSPEGEICSQGQVRFEAHRLLVDVGVKSIIATKWECLDFGTVRQDAEWALNNEAEVLYRHRTDTAAEG